MLESPPFSEVLNTSSLAFDPTALLLVDGEDTLSLEWVRRADCEVVIPGDHFIIADVSAPWADFYFSYRDQGCGVVRTQG